MICFFHILWHGHFNFCGMIPRNFFFFFFDELSSLIVAKGELTKDELISVYNMICDLFLFCFGRFIERIFRIERICSDSIWKT